MLRWRRRLIVIVVLSGTVATLASLRKRLLDQDEQTFRQTYDG